MRKEGAGWLLSLKAYPLQHVRSGRAAEELATCQAAVSDRKVINYAINHRGAASIT